MGLLDAIFAGGGSGGGLLDFLKNNALNQQFPGMPQGDQAQYGQPPAPMMAQAPVMAQQNAPSPLDNAQWPVGPIGAPQRNARPSPMDTAQWPVGPMGAPSQAPIPQNPPPVIQAQPMQGQPAPQEAPQENSFLRGLQSVANGGGIISALSGHYNDPRSIQTNVANLTAQALQAKGVDPMAIHAATAAAAAGNPEPMKLLFNQAFTQKPLMSTGGGHVFDPNTRQDIKTYEPEDKIPAGYARNEKTGGLDYVPGGPADPKTVRALAEAQKKDPNGNYVLGKGGEVVRNNPDGSLTVVHRNEEPADPMDPTAIEILARREIAGDFSGRKNLGRGAQGAADLRAITNRSAQILTDEMGMTPKDAASHLAQKQQEYAAQGQGLSAEARTTGVREANLNLILKAVDAAIPAALEASDKVARTGWVPLNKIIQRGEVIASDPDLKKFGMSNLQLAEHWARAMNPTGVMRESDRDKALSFLSTADSNETYKAAVGQLRTQIERERDAVKATRGMSDLPGSISPTKNQSLGGGWTYKGSN